MIGEVAKVFGLDAALGQSWSARAKEIRFERYSRLESKPTVLHCGGLRGRGRLINYLDGIFLVVMCIFFFLGFKGGILRRGLAVVFLVVGLVLATRTMHTLGAILTGWWNVHEVVGAVLAFVLVIFAAVAAAVIIIAITSRHPQPPRLWSSLGGAVIGLAESALYLSLLLVVLNIYSLPTQQTREKSILYGPVRDFAPFVFDKTNAIFSGSTSFNEELKKSFEKFRLTPSD